MKYKNRFKACIEANMVKYLNDKFRLTTKELADIFDKTQTSIYYYLTDKRGNIPEFREEYKELVVIFMDSLIKDEVELINITDRIKRDKENMKGFILEEIELFMENEYV